jgi:hypothetical protein
MSRGSTYRLTLQTLSQQGVRKIRFRTFKTRPYTLPD